MRTFRLAFAVVRYFPFGGMQRNLVRIARACADRGHEVHLFTSRWDGPRLDDLQVNLVPAWHLTNHGRDASFGRAVRRRVAEGRYDCLVGSNRMRGLDVYYAGDPCYAAAFHRSKPAVLALHPRYRALLRQETQVFARERGTDILLSAHREREKFIRHYDTELQRFVLLPPGIDRQRLEGGALTPEQRVEFRRDLGVGPEDRMILSVGSSFRTKGVDRGILALARLPASLRRRCRLVVVGRGDRIVFKLLAASLGLARRVIFTGPRDDLPPLYHSADLLLHAARKENTGNALIEAMVCGVPVLATGECGYAFHVGEAGAGQVTPEPFSQGTLNRTLRTMLTDPSDQWGRNARAYCDRVDLYTMIERAADAIEARAARGGDRTSRVATPRPAAHPR